MIYVLSFFNYRQLDESGCAACDGLPAKAIVMIEKILEQLWEFIQEDKKSN